MVAQNSDTFPYILGLDVGTNSVGWAVVKCRVEKSMDEKSIDKETGELKKQPTTRYHPIGLHSLNSRIFQEMVDAKTRVPKNQRRQTMRSARRRLDRLQRRRRQLVALLLEHELLPNDFSDAPEQCLNAIDLSFAERILKKKWNPSWSADDRKWISPFAIRAYAVDKPLQPHEFSRLLLHLQRRRGYFSNHDIKYKELDEYIRDELKQPMPQHRHRHRHEDDESNDSENKEKAKETRVVLDAITKLEEEMGTRTLGQYVWACATGTGPESGMPKRITQYSVVVTKQKKDKKSKPDGSIPPVKEAIYFYAQRSMYEDEFNRIWAMQTKQLKLDALEKKIRLLLFYQKPLKSQKKKRVGLCGIISKKRRAPMGTLSFQEYRTRCVINNIRINRSNPNAHDAPAPLSPEERETIYKATQNPEKLNENGRISMAKIADVLKVDRKLLNYTRPDDQDAKSGLVGNRTLKKIYDTVGAAFYNNLTDAQKAHLVTLLLTTENKLALYKCFVNKWGLSEGFDGIAYKLAICEPEKGYGKYSQKAIDILLDKGGIREGLIHSAAMERASRKKLIEIDQEPDKPRRPFDTKDIAAEHIGNPIVEKGLWEIRRIINTLIKRHGHPQVIRIELARNMKESKEDRSKTEKKQSDNRKRNAEAEAEIMKNIRSGKVSGLTLTRYGTVRRSDRDKYKMWKYEQDCKCLFCGNCIGISDLFSGDTEIEHIWPQVGFRQNYMNTTVAHRSCNQGKGKRTPFQAWGHMDSKWDALKKNVERLATEKKLPKAKLRRILQQKWDPEDEHDFVQRQLRDTAYIARKAKQLLEKTGCPVGVSRGGAVSELRHLWGVNNVLPRHPDETVYTETKQQTGANDPIKTFDEKKAKEIKNRKDHRHHAIDAFMVAMTDHATLMELTKRYQKSKERRSHKDARPEDALPLPVSWQDDTNLDALLRDKLLSSVVSHMGQRKVTGALHEETAYGKSFYTTEYTLDTNAATFKKIKQYLVADPEADGIVIWIQNPRMRELLETWVSDNEALKADERSLPKTPEGIEVSRVTLAHRCYTVRKEIDPKTLSSYVDKERIEGKGTWIVDEQAYNSLKTWRKQYSDKDLETNPPRLINKKGRPGELLKRVIVARLHGVQSIASLQQHKIYALGNMHHVVIFHNGKEGKEYKRKASFVYTLEARQRISRAEPIIQRNQPASWEGEWHYLMDLATNDLVYWTGELANNEEGNNQKYHDTHITTPIFRVQIISSVGGGLITLRHHSVATSNDAWGRIISTTNTLHCRKIHLGSLGWTFDQPPLHASET